MPTTTRKTAAASGPRKKSRMDQLLAGSYDIRRYEDLPRPHQLALAHYMAVDGEAWDNFFKLPAGRNSKEAICKALAKALPQYVDKYGRVQFGLARLTTPALMRSVVGDAEIDSYWHDWRAYHQWYLNAESGPDVNHPSRNRWPVILSSFDDETLQDGWHRLHCYVRQGARSIPAVFYPQPRHLRAAGNGRTSAG